MVRRWRYVLVASAACALLSAACGRSSLLTGDAGEESAAGGNRGGSGGDGGTVPSNGGTVVSAGGVSSAGAGAVSGTGGATMNTPLTLLPGMLPAARVRWSYAASFEARGGTGAPFEFRIVNGSLPGDLALALDGRLAGTPTRIGDYPLKVEVRDGAGMTEAREYVLRVEPPRFLASGTFLSSSSTRRALHLTDINRPDPKTYTLRDGSPSESAFSADGRWFAYCNDVANGNGELFYVNTAGAEPGPQQQLLEPSELVPCGGWVWSPDRHRIAYIHDGGLWMATLDDAGTAQRTKLVTGVTTSGLGWPLPDLLLLRDDQGRANALRLTSGAAARTIVDVPQASLRSASPSGELALAQSAAGYWLVDAETGAAEALGPWPSWFVSPAFGLLLGRANSGEFSVYTPTHAKLPSALRTGTGANSFGGVAFSTTHEAVAQQEGAQLVVTDVENGQARVRPVAGAYDVPRGATFDGSGSVLVFSDRNGVWLTDTTDAALTAHVASQHGPDAHNLGPHFELAARARRLLAGGGAPYELRLVSFDDPQKPAVSAVAAQLEWSEASWSPDGDRLAILGGSPPLGRVMYLVDVARPSEPLVIGNCKSNGGSEPRCPFLGQFQP